MASLQRRVLEVLVLASGPLTARDLPMAKRSSVRGALSRLVRRDLAERHDNGYRATQAGLAAVEDGRRLNSGIVGPRGSRLGGLPHRAWRQLRMDAVVTSGDLLRLSGDERRDERNQRTVLHRYLRQLVRAGYVRPEGSCRRGNQRAWRLIRNTGPLPPAAYRPNDRLSHNAAEGLWDPNLQELVPWTR